MMTWRQSWSPRTGGGHAVAPHTRPGTRVAPDTRPQRAVATVPQTRAPGPWRCTKGVARTETISNMGRESVELLTHRSRGRRPPVAAPPQRTPRVSGGSTPNLPLLRRPSSARPAVTAPRSAESAEQRGVHQHQARRHPCRPWPHRRGANVDTRAPNDTEADPVRGGGHRGAGRAHGVWRPPPAQLQTQRGPRRSRASTRGNPLV